MMELSIFIDESGDAGPVSRYYIVTLVFHEQATELKQNIAAYERNVRDCELDVMPFHFGPLLTGHDDYQWVSIRNRKKQLSLFRQFVDRSPITYRPFIYDKKQGLYEPQKLSEKIERDVTLFLADHLAYMQSFDHVKIYYDGGQSVVTRASRCHRKSHFPKGHGLSRRFAQNISTISGRRLYLRDRAHTP